MRILHLVATPFFSGPAEAVVQLALAQRARGHEVTVACDRRRTEVTAEELFRPKLEALGLLEPAQLELSVKSLPWGLARDVLTLRSLKADVVHAHFSHDHTLARLGRPKDSLLVRSIHAPRSLRRTTPKANAWTVPTAPMARRLLGERVLVLQAFVGPEFTPPASRSKLREELGLADVPTAGMVSTFQPSRKHRLALQAFALVHRRKPETHFVLVGDGALEPSLRKHVQADGLEGAVRFAGYHSGPDFVRWLQALDEVWILGLGNDFSARAAAQARACGVRVLAVDEGALARYADVLVEPSAESVASMAFTAVRRELELESVDVLADRVLSLYGGMSMGSWLR